MNQSVIASVGCQNSVNSTSFGLSSTDMCGINGIAFSPHSGKQVMRESLIRMRDILHHRGPDGEGSFINGNIGLGHRRLSIVDIAHEYGSDD